MLKKDDKRWYMNIAKYSQNFSRGILNWIELEFYEESCKGVSKHFKADFFGISYTIFMIYFQLLFFYQDHKWEN